MRQEDREGAVRGVGQRTARRPARPPVRRQHQAQGVEPEHGHQEPRDRRRAEHPGRHRGGRSRAHRDDVDPLGDHDRPDDEPRDRPPAAQHRGLHLVEVQGRDRAHHGVEQVGGQQGVPVRRRGRPRTRAGGPRAGRSPPPGATSAPTSTTTWPAAAAGAGPPPGPGTPGRAAASPAGSTGGTRRCPRRRSCAIVAELLRHRRRRGARRARRHREQRVEDGPREVGREDQRDPLAPERRHALGAAQRLERQHEAGEGEERLAGEVQEQLPAVGRRRRRPSSPRRARAPR